MIGDSGIIATDTGGQMNADKRLRLYLDVTIPNHLFADDRPDWMATTQELWDVLILGSYKIVLSPLFFEELERCPQPKLGQMYEQLGIIPFETLSKTDDVTELAIDYIKNGVLTQKNLNDCLHIAYAVINGCDVLLSWNFDHTRDWTKGKVKYVNAIRRYKAIEILSPEAFLARGYK